MVLTTEWTTPDTTWPCSPGSSPWWTAKPTASTTPAAPSSRTRTTATTATSKTGGPGSGTAITFQDLEVTTSIQVCSQIISMHLSCTNYAHCKVGLHATIYMNIDHGFPSKVMINNIFHLSLPGLWEIWNKMVVGWSWSQHIWPTTQMPKVLDPAQGILLGRIQRVFILHS